MRTPTGTVVLACVLSAVLLLPGCGGHTTRHRDTARHDDAGTVRELLLQPAAAPGPDPFTDSTALTAATPSPAPRTPHRTDRASDAEGPRILSGGTPGLYGGTEGVGSCDIGRQIGHLTRDPARGRAFAEAAGISPAALPDHVRALTPVVLRADTRVTGHGLRAGRITRYQSVLQAGTAVLVDDRGLPRVRCACGNPLGPPEASRGTVVTRGTAWPGYRPGRVIAVTPAPQAVIGFTIIDLATRTWIERLTGHDVRHDRALPPPARVTDPPDPSRPAPSPSQPHVPPEAEPSTEPDADPGGASPGDTPAEVSLPDAETPLPPSGGTAPRPDPPAAPEDPGGPDEIGPEAVPDHPDPPDGAGLIPDDRAAARIPGSPTGIFGNREPNRRRGS
ncbi:hypothetical protein BJ965_000769 [Streptomyces luteogriseus]|uniref:DUF6777 domain-containing protein n=1 Tax=Streptomyces luteogriseus TaxID=68233 RepID=A0A7W7DHN0_9ACTN|nr:DUF6777 domain-containing protein [Streptomyces luteogriseus]MBB4710887.1 hypothetical protein [Streptomyces luteogriseus]